MRVQPAWREWTAKQWEGHVSTYGTPLYVFDAEFVRQRVRLVKAAFGERVGVYYALKANPNLALFGVQFEIPLTVSTLHLEENFVRP